MAAAVVTREVLVLLVDKATYMMVNLIIGGNALSWAAKAYRWPLCTVA